VEVSGEELEYRLDCIHAYTTANARVQHTLSSELKPMAFLATHCDSLLKGVLESSSDLVSVIDTELCFLAANTHYSAAFNHVFGVEAHIGANLADLLAHVPEERDRALALWQRALSGEEFTVTSEFGAPQRQRRVFEITYRKLCEGDRQIGAIQFARDITATHAIERAKLRSEERFRQLADAMPQLVWSADANGVVDYYNERAESYAGIERGEADSWEWAPTVHPDDRPATVEAWRNAVETGEAYEIEHRVKLDDGSYRWHLSRGMPVRDEQKRVVRWYGTATDIEETKRAELELRQADHRKNEFLAMLGHELRNPLAAISNGIRVVERGGEPGREALPMVQRHVDQMSRLLDDLLDISRITRGKLRVDRKVRWLRPMIASAINAVRPWIAQFDHSLEVDPVPDVAVNADPTRLEQVICNLLDNAASYTPPGGDIRLWVEVDEETVSVFVRDSGKGIEARHLESIFEPFSQSDGGKGRGLGIGLALVQQLVELHDGTVQVRSEGQGKGSEFVVRLPRAPDELLEADEHPCQSAPRLDGLRILAVDDNIDACHFMALLLGDAGCQVETAATGDEGLRRADEADFDVVLLDIGLPDIDGREVARRLRDKPGYAGARIVAVSGYNQEHDVLASKEAGFDAHLGKPISPETLRAVISGDQTRPTAVRRHRSPGEGTMFPAANSECLDVLELLAQLSHDVRSPLSSVEYSGALLAHSDDESVRDIAERLLRATSSVTAMLDGAIEQVRSSQQ
jgi:PAS domain S-box-containing protein